MFGLSKRQKQVLDAVVLLQAENGWCPSYDEIAAKAGIKTKSEIWRLLKQLEARGHIKRLPGQARSIQVIHGPDNL